MSDVTARDIAQVMMETMPFIGRLFDAEMRANDYVMSPIHFHVLNRLRVRPYSLGELAQVHTVSAASMSNTVTVLEERDWVQRVRSIDDRRVVTVQITSAGLEMLQTMYDKAESYIATLFEPLSPDDRRELLNALTTARDKFRILFALSPLETRHEPDANQD